MEKKIKSFDSTEIHYRIKRFRNKKPLLVFVHGLGGNSSAWVPIIKFFESKKYSTLYFDVRGHGKSGKPRKRSAYAFKNNVRDFYEIVKKEKLKKFIILGHSSGGMIGLKFYEQFPEYVSAMVLISTNYTNPLKFFIIPADRLTWLVKGGASLIALIGKIFKRRNVVYVYYYKYRKSSELYLLWKDLLGTPLEIFMWSFMEIIDFDATKLLPRITTPTLLLAGKHDWITKPSCAEYMHKKIRNSKLELISETEHSILFENVDETAKTLFDFVKRIK